MKLEARKMELIEVSFDEWNSQFKTSKFGLNKKIPGFDLTILAFRKKIFNAETNGNTIGFEQFKKELNQRHNQITPCASYL